MPETITVHVRSILALAERLRAKQFDVALPEGSTALSLLAVIAERLRVPFDEETCLGQRNGSIHREFAMSINGHGLVGLDGVDTVLRDGDDVLLLPPVAGG